MTEGWKTFRRTDPREWAKVIEERGFAVGDIVTFKKYYPGYDYVIPVEGCKILGFTKTNWVQIEVPPGVLENGKNTTRVSPTNLEKPIRTR